jgi:hypothetical protein
MLVAITQPSSEEQAAKHHVKANMRVTEVRSNNLRKVAELADTGEIKAFVGTIHALAEVDLERRIEHNIGVVLFTIGTLPS